MRCGEGSASQPARGSFCFSRRDSTTTTHDATPHSRQRFNRQVGKPHLERCDQSRVAAHALCDGLRLRVSNAAMTRACPSPSTAALGREVRPIQVQTQWASAAVHRSLRAAGCSSHKALQQSSSNSSAGDFSDGACMHVAHSPPPPGPHRLCTAKQATTSVQDAETRGLEVVAAY